MISPDPGEISYNPGRFINRFIDDKYGRIDEGFAGSLTIIDRDSPVKVSRHGLKTKCGWSPFEDIVFPGNAVYTVIKGRIYKCWM